MTKDRIKDRPRSPTIRQDRGLPMTDLRWTLSDLRTAIERADIPDDVRADLLAHLDPSDTRTRIVRVRMTDAERDVLRQAADEAGMTISGYLRSLLRPNRGC